MAGKEVIRAAQMFTKSGVASKTSVVKEIVIASALGMGLGLWWQKYHWAEDAKWEAYYKSIEEK